MVLSVQNRCLIGLGNTFSFVVHHTQIVLGRGIPLFGKRRPFTESSCVITTLECGPTLLEILAPRHPRTSKKQGNGEADGGGQVFHTESLAENGNGANTLVGALWASLYEQ